MDNDGIANKVQTFHNINLKFWLSGSHERTVERKVGDLRRKLKTIVATLPFILPSHAYEDLVRHVVQCENMTTNLKCRPDCPEDVMRMHRGLNRLQFSIQELAFSFGDVVLVNNAKKRPKGKHNAHPRTMGIVLGTWRESGGRTKILPIPPDTMTWDMYSSYNIEPAVTSETADLLNLTDALRDRINDASKRHNARQADPNKAHPLKVLDTLCRNLDQPLNSIPNKYNNLARWKRPWRDTVLRESG